jgi:undecaprenyl-diphosphatase
MDDPQQLWFGLALGLVQGITEFLPISSDGHLATFALLFGMADLSLPWVVLLHVGTLLATVIVFADDLMGLLRRFVAGVRTPGDFLRSDDGILLRNIVLSSIPTAVIGLTLEDAVEGWAKNPLIVGACLLLTAGAVFSTRTRNGRAPHLSAMGAVLVGVAQGAAVLPGLSRSGSTIALAMALGMQPASAFRYSFLLSMPAIFGATVLELGHDGALSGLTVSAWIGAVVSFASGLICLRLLRNLVTRGHFWRFVWYLVPLGSGLILWGFFGGGA